MRTIFRILVGAFSLWVTTMVVGGNSDHGVWVVPFADDSWGHFWTLILVAAIFGLVNATLGKIVRFVSIPLYFITLGLFGVIVNGFLLWVVAWVSSLMGFGLMIESFWWGVLGAIVLSLLSGILNSMLGTSKRDSKSNDSATQ